LEVDKALVNINGGMEIISAVKELGSEVGFLPDATPLVRGASSILKWKRRVTRIWNDTCEIWESIPERIEYEPFILVRVLATEFARKYIQFG
jgi:hypothetical protein